MPKPAVWNLRIECLCVRFVDIRDSGDPVVCAQACCRASASILLAASVFHFGIIAIPELKAYLKKRGVKIS